jgi:hypothetical protein
MAMSGIDATPDRELHRRWSASDEPVCRLALVQRSTGNPMQLVPGRLSEMVREARAREGFIVCHDTLPYGPHPGYGPAVCRGFYDRYDTRALQVAHRLWGVVDVPPPAALTTEQPTVAPAEPAATTVAAQQRQPSTIYTRPLVFVDVDGVLNPAGSNPDDRGYRPHPFTRLGADGKAAGGIVWLHPDHGRWLGELEAAGGQPAWATFHCPTPLSKFAVDQVAIEGEPEGGCQTGETDADQRDGC